MDLAVRGTEHPIIHEGGVDLLLLPPRLKPGEQCGIFGACLLPRPACCVDTGTSPFIGDYSIHTQLDIIAMVGLNILTCGGLVFLIVIVIVIVIEDPLPRLCVTSDGLPLAPLRGQPVRHEILHHTAAQMMFMCIRVWTIIVFFVVTRSSSDPVPFEAAQMRIEVGAATFDTTRYELLVMALLLLSPL